MLSRGEAGTAYISTRMKLRRRAGPACNDDAPCAARRSGGKHSEGQARADRGKEGGAESGGSSLALSGGSLGGASVQMMAPVRVRDQLPLQRPGRHHESCR